MKKDHVLEAGLKLELDIRRSMRKAQLFRVVSEGMLDNNIFDRSVLDNRVTNTPELSEAQIELEKLKIETETQIKQARFSQEIRFKEMEEERVRPEEEQNNFDLTKHIWLVPTFNEEDVDKYPHTLWENHVKPRVAYRSTADITTESSIRLSTREICFTFSYRQRWLRLCKNVYPEKLWNGTRGVKAKV